MPRRIPFLLLLLILIFAVLLRLTNLYEEPLDFNPSRQLYSAIIARAIYYNLQPDADPTVVSLVNAHRDSLERLEPPILETIVAGTYLLLGGEQLWVARVYAILFWTLGGLALYHLSRALLLTAPDDPHTNENSRFAALLPLAYYLYLPLSVYASRSFQPDPGMVMWLILFAWAAWRWVQVRTWKWAILAGVLGGIAVVVKAVAAYFVGMSAIFLVLNEGWMHWEALKELGWRQKLAAVTLRILSDKQVWVVAILIFALALLAYGNILLQSVVVTSSGENSSLYTRTVFYRWRDVVDPSFYMRWLLIVDRLLGLPVILAAFVGAWLFPPRRRALLLGLWVGYALYGMSFPKIITSHDYYHLPLVFIVALSLTSLAGVVIEHVRGLFPRLVLVGVVALSIAYNGWITRSVLVAQDFADAPAFWQTVGDAIPEKGRAVGYSQDYGFRLMYYGWRRIDILQGDISSDEFLTLSENADYFVVTAKNQMSAELADYAPEHYPVLTEGGGYIVYDLRP